MDAFWQGANNSQNMINSMMKNRYDQGMLGVNQSRQDYNQKILPYLIQQYQTKARQVKDQEDFANYLMGRGNGQQDNQFAQPQNPSAPVIRSPVDAQTANAMSKDQLVQRANQDQANYDAAHGYTPQQQNNINPQQMPNQGMTQQSVNPSPQSQMQNAPNQQQTSGAPVPDYIHSNLQKNLQLGQEMLVKRGQLNPSINRAAGFKIYGMPVPAVKRDAPVDGIQYSTYPNGDVTAKKVGPNTFEKAQSEAQAKSDVKYKDDTDKYFSNLATYAGNNEAIAKIMERNPKATGIFQSGKRYLKMGSEDQASFNRLAVPMVGQLAKDLSQRGGAVALNYAQGGKYDSAQPYESNQGILKETNNAIIRDYNREAKVYKERTGKNPPYELPKYYRDWEKAVRIQSPDGHIAIKSPEDAAQLVKKYPGAKILGNVYEQY